MNKVSSIGLVISNAFIALLIFARAILDKPNNFTYNCCYRTKPYLK